MSTTTIVYVLAPLALVGIASIAIQLSWIFKIGWVNARLVVRINSELRRSFRVIPNLKGNGLWILGSARIPKEAFLYKLIRETTIRICQLGTALR